MKWTNKGHEFDSIGYLLKGKKNVILYGAGQQGKELYDLLMSLNGLLNWNIVFADRNIELQKHGINGTLVLSFDELSKLDKEECFIIVCTRETFRNEIISSLIEVGWEVMTNVFEYDFFLYKYLSIHFIYNYDMVYISSISILPSTVCNLNCKGCLNFNPYIKKHITYSLESLKEDCDALFNAIDLIGRFQITGGEPLFYPHLIELIKYIGQNYGGKIIRFELVTNSTITPSDELCDAMRENKIYVFVDDYRKNVKGSESNYLKVIEKLQKFNVSFRENCVSTWFDLTPNLNEEKDITEEETIDLFTNCECPWSTLNNKSISACNYSLYSTKAGIVKFDERDYYDLTKVNKANKKEFIEFRLRFNERGYVELCKRCAGFNNNNYIEPAVQIPKYSK